MKEKLRPCIVKIGEETEISYNAVGERKNKIVKEADVYKAFFHKWYKEDRTERSAYTLLDCGIKSKLLAVVEYEDGTVHLVEPECITFTDRYCKE